MGYTTCLGKPETKHYQEERCCDGCGRCPHPFCGNFMLLKLWCWTCCGRLVACPGCALRVAQHVVKRGPPEGQWAERPEVLAGYRAACSVVRGLPQDQRGIMQRFPRLVAHMICDSLGYHTPNGAAGALRDYLWGLPNACEWYCHMARGSSTEGLLEVGREAVMRAFQQRRGHTGMMAEYRQARALVEHVNAGGKEPVFGSWF